MQYVVQLLQCIDFNKIVPYNDSATAENDAFLRMDNNTLWALINFTQPGYDKLKPTLTYSIRMSTALIGDTYISDRFYTLDPRSRPLYDLKYITFGFAYLQDMVEQSIIQEHTGRESTPGIVLQQFPYPCYIEDQFIKAVSKTFPLFMVLSWVFACSMICKSIVYEKQERLKEMMRVMGLSNGVHWTAWFIDSIVVMIITAVLLSLLLVYGHVIQHSNPVIIFIFLVSFCVATIAQSFLYSVLFDQANIAAASGGIIYFLLYLPYPFLSNWLNVLPPLVNYFITIPQDHNHTDHSSNQPSSDPEPDVTQLIRSFLPAANIHKISGSEVTYVLPQDPASMGAYVSLFESLSENRAKLGIDSYGISDTSLEEVIEFLYFISGSSQVVFVR
ncbi:ATP-binding cassette sub-family A member 1-like [Diaphorina citri]|uniref:ATP-binding cassette sub-family A member 1-like n=1 Tax=Diaphorina citri TaxID=121845 RepID=A0A1S3DV98_DIACI|nr:ATP-binding cassette sub-family A member 1-like [Diaphorina citri]